MAPVREVYTYTVTSVYTSIPLAASSTSIGTTLTNTAEIQNTVYTLYDTKKNIVGKDIINKNINSFDKNNGYVSNSTYLFNDGSYVMTLKFVEHTSNIAPPNTTYTHKAVSTGGKYAGKDVTVTVKTDNTLTRKLIITYDK
jgi:hypothetical protein